MKMPLNPNPLEARQPGSGAAPTQGAQGATGVGATAGDRRDPNVPLRDASRSLNRSDPLLEGAPPRTALTRASASDACEIGSWMKARLCRVSWEGSVSRDEGRCPECKPKTVEKIHLRNPLRSPKRPLGFRKRNPSRPGFQAFTEAPGIADTDPSGNFHHSTNTFPKLAVVKGSSRYMPSPMDLMDSIPRSS